ncbi:helix-turn-helix transcriptional regulator [bacterium 210820-DFI.6.52]|nr:helix-turn-helix transcriptional regulator [bacterium 210820-DFI.6.52]
MCHNRNARNVAVRKISYKRLWVQLIERDISRPTLKRDVNLSSGTMCKLNKGEDVSLSVLLRICDYLNCDIGDICEAVRED